MESIYCTSKGFTMALGGLPTRGASGFTGEEELKAVIAGFVRDLCRDFQIGTDQIVPTCEFQNQYVHLRGSGVKRIYALRKSPRRRIKGFSCYATRPPPPYIEITITMAKKVKCPMLEDIYDKYIEMYGSLTSPPAIYPRLNGCVMELAFPQPSKQECEDLFVKGLKLEKPTISKAVNGKSPTTATIKVSPFMPAPPGIGSSSLEKIKEVAEENLEDQQEAVTAAREVSGSIAEASKDVSKSIAKSPAGGPTENIEDAQDPREGMRQEKRQLAIAIAQLLVLADPEADDELDSLALALAENVESQAAAIVRSLKRRRED